MVNVNDFYKDWTLQTEEYFDDRIVSVTDVNKNINQERVEDNYTRRTRVNIDSYTSSGNKITSDNDSYTYNVTRDLRVVYHGKMKMLSYPNLIYIYHHQKMLITEIILIIQQQILQNTP